MMSDSRKQAPRDPEARRKAIIEAAADLILHSGFNGLTHRRVAERAAVPLGSTTYYFASLDEMKEEALDYLAEMIDLGIEEVSSALKDSDDLVETLARLFHQYLGDRDRVRADTAFYIAGSENPSLRPLSARWFNGLVELLQDYTDRATARAIALLADGVSIHAIINEDHLSEDELREILTRIVGENNA